MGRFWAWLAELLGWTHKLDTIETIPIVEPLSEPQNTPVEPSLPTKAPSMTNAEKLVAAAKSCLGQNLSAGTGVSPEVACAISLNKVVYKALGKEIGGGASTFELYKAIQKDSRFKEIPVDLAKPGTILIDPTGYGKKVAYPHGHCALVANYGICSNDSAKGVWSENYADLAAWRHQFETVEGYPTFAFAPVDK